jgi:hypothetical protein
MDMMIETPLGLDFERPSGYKDEIVARADRVRWLRIPWRRYLVIDGTEPPGSPDFQDAIGTLYPVAYALHFALKAQGSDAPVGALQGLYWRGGTQPTNAGWLRDQPDDLAGWRWRLLLPIPDTADTADIEAAIRGVRSRKEPPRIDELWVLSWEEGPVAQTLHIGPYADEPATVARLHAAIADAGLHQRGVHHEIYISDPSRARSDRMRTLLRQGVTT